MLAIKIILFFILFAPMAILTGIIWLFGGWTQSPYMSPNPLDWLYNKLLK